MSNRLQVGLTDDLLKMLAHNGIDASRCVDFKLEHTPGDGPIFITVKMLALKDEPRSSRENGPEFTGRAKGLLS